VSILDTRIHRRIIADIRRYSDHAGVPQHAISNGLEHYCGQSEIDWVVRYLRARANPPVPVGLAYMGDWGDMTRRMVGIAGCMVRNFVDARVMTVQRATDEMATCTLLLIPRIPTGKALLDWKVSQLVDLLTDRMNADKCTVVAIGKNLEALKVDHGQDLAEAVGRYEVLKP